MSPWPHEPNRKKKPLRQALSTSLTALSDTVQRAAGSNIRFAGMGMPPWMALMSPLRDSRNRVSNDIGVRAKEGQPRTRRAPSGRTRPNRQDDTARTRRESPRARADDKGNDHRVLGLFIVGKAPSGLRDEGRPGGSGLSIGVRANKYGPRARATTRSDALRCTARIIARPYEDGKGEKGRGPILFTADGAPTGLQGGRRSQRGSRI